MKKLTTLSLLSMLAITACKKEGDQKTAEADTKKHGLQTEFMDTKVHAGDDFFRYVNGLWYDKTDIPADKTTWGSFDELAHNTDLDVLDILKDAAKDTKIDAASDQGKAISLYTTYLDTVSRNNLGIAPIKPELDKINALQTTADINQLIINSIFDGGIGFFGTYVSADAKDSNKNVVYVTTGETGLPDRDYYLAKDADTKEKLALYKKHVAKMLQFLGTSAAQATVDAEKIVAVEAQMATAELDRVALRDDRKTYNPMTVAELQKLTPAVNWTAYFDAAGLKNLTQVVVSQPNYMKVLNTILTKTPVADLKLYLTWTLLNGSTSQLSTTIDKANFEFYGKVLSGAVKQRPLDERALQTVNNNIGEALGKLYVEKRFPAEAKAKAKDMIENIIKAYEIRINNLTWMAPDTKKGAIDKLKKLTIKIGYPDKWEDYSKLSLTGKDKGGKYYDNMRAITKWAIEKNIAEYGKPVDKTKWGMPPQMVNAYYNPAYNEIVFPAAILQPPFYDYKADEAVNYGGIGAVIGHEISHGFDDSGARYNADGNLMDWWTAKDLEQFTVLGKSLAKQYSALEPFKGIFVDGEFTLGENIGDLGGVTAAYEGLQLYLKQHGRPEKIDGFTPEQRFFISWATIWRTKSRDEYVKTQVKTDPHAPALYRAYVPLQNIDAWYDAFEIKEGNKMYIKPEERVRIW